MLAVWNNRAVTINPRCAHPMGLDWWLPRQGTFDALLSFSAVRWAHFLGVLSTPEELPGHDHRGGFQQQS